MTEKKDVENVIGVPRIVKYDGGIPDRVFQRLQRWAVKWGGHIHVKSMITHEGTWMMLYDNLLGDDGKKIDDEINRILEKRKGGKRK